MSSVNNTHSFIRYASQSVANVLAHFQVDTTQGLSAQDVQTRLKQYGYNTIEKTQISWFDVLKQQFFSPFVYLFLIAGLLLIVAQEVFNGLLVFTFVLTNALVGFYQEYKAARNLQLMNKYLASFVTVYRGGKQERISSTDLVPGDIVLLSPGQKIPADIRFIAVRASMVDEAVLTGESMTVAKTVDVINRPDISVFQAKNIGFAGTTHVSGSATGVVFATGSATYMGTVTQLGIAQTVRESTLVKGTVALGTFLIRFVFGTMSIIFVLNLLIKGSAAHPIEFLVFVLTLILTILPEALPVVVTLCLTNGAMRLAQYKVIVKRLSAIEELGSITVLCTDKTGTITENKMKVLATHGQHTRDDILVWAALAAMRPAHTDQVLSNGFDSALWHALDEQQRDRVLSYNQLDEIPFDHVRLRNAVAIKQHDNMYLVIRGAPEGIMALSGLNQEQQKDTRSWMAQEGVQGRRVLAVAQRTITDHDMHNLLAAESDNSFSWVGLISFEDPVKQTALATIKKAKMLGITIKVLSGDSKEVCVAIARQATLIEQENQVITGQEFAQKSSEEKQMLIDRIAVFARVLPEQKHEIIQLLQAKQYTVGYMGDGINDVPALRVADVSIAVADATQLARETADIILLQRSFRSIIDGIQEGRTIVVNTLKYVRTTIAANFGNFYAIGLASLFINYLPMQPFHILLVNVLTDLPMIAIAADTVDQNDIRRPRSFSVRSILGLALLLGLVSSLFDFIFFAIFSRISPAALQTGWFIESVLTELVFIFSVRTRTWAFVAQPPSRTIMILSLLVAIVALVAPQLSVLAPYSGFTPLKHVHLMIIVGLVILYFVATELVKIWYYQKFNSHSS